jgi:microsomal dipeptidase-like Zn-dependent dipeptidase
MYRMLDLHVHPSLKMYYLPYLRANFHANVYSGKHWNPLSFRTQYDNLSNSPVKLLMNAHYVIEGKFVRDGLKWFTRAAGFPVGLLVFSKLIHADPFKTVLGQMDLLEKAVINTNKHVPKDGKRLKMVFNPSEIDQLADNEIGVVHAIEGSHALGYGPEKGQDKDAYWHIARQRLHHLKQRGLSMVTLAHFWDNMFSPQTDGTEIIPMKVNGKVVAGRDDAVNHMKRATWRWGDKNYLSREIVEEMLTLGILIDLSHTQEHARKSIIEMCEQHKRPVIASHVGLQHFFNHEYNISDAEILQIHKVGGVIGLILSTRQLVDPISRFNHTGEGIGHFVDNARHIADVAGDVDCIGLGTDFDGLTHPFTDCHVPSGLEKLGDALSREFSADEVDAMLWGNSLRALKAGWDGAQAPQK